MKLAGGMLCRSHAATALCVPGDALSMVAARHAGRPAVVGDARLTGVRYTRLGDGKPRSRGRERRQAAMAVAVALPMAEKGSREAAPPPPAAKRPAPAPARAMPAPLPADLVFQVVVMKVAIHCQGCAGKVRKHISKMEGVTSFSIDLESKRVTVTGHVSPAVVLESVSKVKKAELWPSCM